MKKHFLRFFIGALTSALFSFSAFSHDAFNTQVHSGVFSQSYGAGDPVPVVVNALDGQVGSTKIKGSYIDALCKQRGYGSIKAPLVFFGDPSTMSPLSVGRVYRFAVQAGVNVFEEKAYWVEREAMRSTIAVRPIDEPQIRVVAYKNHSRDESEPSVLDVYLPKLNTPEWDAFLSAGASKTVEDSDLITTIRVIPDEAECLIELSHVAKSSDYTYIVEFISGIRENGSEGGYLPLAHKAERCGSSKRLRAVHAPVYALRFDPVPAWQFTSVELGYDRVSTIYEGTPSSVSVPEQLVKDLELSDGLRLDHAHELKRAPELDSLVGRFKGDPLCSLGFIFNEIELADMLTYREDSPRAYAELGVSGIARSALGVLLEGQGSPLELCALTVFLLRSCGVPAYYAFPREKGLGIAASRLRGLLGPVSEGDDSIVQVFYPWVVANIDGSWVNIFPWLRDLELSGATESGEAPMDASSRGSLWAKAFLESPHHFDSASILDAYTAHLKDSGYQIASSRAKTKQSRYYYALDKFPLPDFVPDSFEIVDSLDQRGVCYDTIRIEAVTNDSFKRTREVLVDTGEIPVAELSNRRLSASWERVSGQRSFSVTFDLLDNTASPTNVAVPFHCLSSSIQNQSLRWIDSGGEKSSVELLIHYRRPSIDDSKSACEWVESRVLNHNEFASLCVNSGKVTRSMVQRHKSALDKIIKEVSLKGSADDYLLYAMPCALMGAEYFEKMSLFSELLLPLCSGRAVSSRSIAFAKFVEDRSSGDLTITPMLDVFRVNMGVLNQCSLNARSGSIWDGRQDYFALYSLESSLREAWAVGHLFDMFSPVSAVKLLKYANNIEGEGIIRLTQSNFHKEGERIIGGKPLRGHSPKLWSKIESYFHPNAAHSQFSEIFVTPGALKYGDFEGVAAFVTTPYGSDALLEEIHGGYGESMHVDSLFSRVGGAFSASHEQAKSLGFDFSEKAFLEDPIFEHATSLDRYVDTWSMGNSFSYMDASRQVFSGSIPRVFKHVDLITGALSWSEEDLVLQGAFPFVVRRDYSTSLSRSSFSSLGFGWSLWFLEPFIFEGDSVSLVTPDGGRIRFKAVDENLYLSSGGADGASLTFLEQKKQFILQRSSGEKIIYQCMHSGSPKLSSWSDALGNAYFFDYTQEKASRLIHISGTNGLSLSLDYDDLGRLVRIATKDGRCVSLHYDRFGDLVEVERLGESSLYYTYQKDLGWESTHLLERRANSEGVFTEYVYDVRGRVVAQNSSLGNGFEGVPQYSYVYEKNHSAPNAGMTTLYALGQFKGRFYYESGLMLKEETASGAMITQEWSSPDVALGESFPLLRRSEDVRGLKRLYEYDKFGHCTQLTLKGRLTGIGEGEEAVYRYEYDNLGRLISSTDPLGDKKVTYYGDDALRYLPVRMETLHDGQCIACKEFVYEPEQMPSGHTWVALKQERECGFGSPDAVIHWDYDSQGRIISKTEKTGTEDPDITHFFEYTPRGELARVVYMDGACVSFEYDMPGNLIEKTYFDAGGQELARESWEYDKLGRLLVHYGPKAYPASFVRYDYGKHGLVDRVITPRIEASPSGDAVFVNGVNVTEVGYDSLGRRVSLSSSYSGVEHFVYDNADRIVAHRVSSHDGELLSEEAFVYNNADDLVERITNSGAKAFWDYSQEGRMISFKDINGLEAYQHYDLVGRLAQSGISGGATILYSYDYKNGISRVIERHQSGEITDENERLVDARGNLLSFKDALGNDFSFSYDGLGRIVSWQGPRGGGGRTMRQVSALSYDPVERMIIEERSGFKFVTEDDVLGRVVQRQIFDSNGALCSQSRWVHEGGGRKITEVRGLEGQSVQKEIFFDDSGNIILQHWDDNLFESFSYDGGGNLVFQRKASGIISQFEYDALNRLVSRKMSGAPEVLVHYDHQGHFIETTVGGTLVHKAVRDLNGQVVFESLTSGDKSIRECVYHYFEEGPFAGLLRNAKYQDGTQVEYTYDALRRPISVQGFSQNGIDTVDYSYDLLGHLASVRTRSAKTEVSTEVEREHDAYGQLVFERVKVNDSIMDEWTQRWDAMGMRVRLDSSDLSLSYEYDGQGNLVKICDNWNNIYRYSYDLAGRLVARANPWRTLQLGYSSQAIRPATLVTSLPGRSDYTFAEAVQYNKGGKIASVSRSIPGDASQRVSMQLAYDAVAGRLLGEYVTEEGLLRSVDYGYDVENFGNCVSRTQPGGWNFSSTVDQWGRVYSQNYEVGRRRFTAWGAAPGARSVDVFVNQKHWSPVYFNPQAPEAVWYAELDLPMGEHVMRVDALDASGEVNSTESTFTVQGQTNSASLRYDDRGNVVQKSFADGTVHDFTWDAWGRLVELKGSGPQGSFSWNGIYDGFGRKLRAEYRSGQGAAPVVVDSSYDPEVEFLEIKAKHNDHTHCFVYGPDLNQTFGGLQGVGGLEAVISGDGRAQGMVHDAWGNVLGSSDGMDIRWNSMHLTAYGPEPTQHPSIFPWEQDWSKVFAWRGHRLDSSGYYNMGARPYDAGVVSFLSPDPHGFDFCGNLYAYANGDPANAYDPDGRSAYLLDGTWAHEEGMQNNPALTNAQRLHLSYVGPGESHYFRGVGNSKDNSWFAQYWGGATGAGAREIVDNAYDEIVANYNNGDTHIFIAGWSRGAAECMELAWTLYLRGIPNLKRGGYLVPPEQQCPVIDQIHLMDTVHSMGVPGNNINRGWHDLDMPPNIYRTYHYLAGEPPSFGFRQTRPPSANERAYCGVHGDVGGSLDTDCRRWVYRSIVEHANGHGLALFDEDSIEDYLNGDPSL